MYTLITPKRAKMDFRKYNNKLTDSERVYNKLKGRIAEVLLEELFTNMLGRSLIRTGQECRFNDLLSSCRKTPEMFRPIQKLPDFFYSYGDNETFIEVKYRANGKIGTDELRNIYQDHTLTILFSANNIFTIKPKYVLRAMKLGNAFIKPRKLLIETEDFKWTEENIEKIKIVRRMAEGVLGELENNNDMKKRVNSPTLPPKFHL